MYAGLDRNGKQRQATRVVRGTQAQATKARRALQVEIEQSRTDSGAPGSFAELAERWYRMGRAGWSPSTAHGYRAHLDNHLIPVLGSIPADRLKPKDLDGLYLSLAEGRRTTRPMSAASVESIHRTVRAILNFGVSHDEIKTNPAKPPVRPGRPSSWSRSPAPRWSRGCSRRRRTRMRRSGRSVDWPPLPGCAAESWPRFE